MAIFPRSYGAAGPLVVLLHGGPGAPGQLEPVGRKLAHRFRVLENAERRAPPDPDAEPLSVASHVADLRALLRARYGRAQVMLIGHSSGAIIALAYAAAHPAAVRGVVLVGCATMGERARTAFRAALQVRLDAAARAVDQRVSQVSVQYRDTAQSVVIACSSRIVAMSFCEPRSWKRILSS